MARKTPLQILEEDMMEDDFSLPFRREEPPTAPKQILKSTPFEQSNILASLWMDPMEKNSVVQVNKPASPGQKTSAAVTCPKCGATCQQRGQVFACPEHGTEPFEKPNG